APPHRADRITALLAGRRQWSADGMPAIHMDTHLASAAPVLDLLATLPGDGDGGGDGDGPGEPLSAPAAALRDRLLRWDRRMDADSADAAAFAAVRGALVRRLAAAPAFAPLTTPPAYPEVYLPWLALVPRVGHALEHLLAADDLFGIHRPAAARAAPEGVARRAPAPASGGPHRRAVRDRPPGRRPRRTGGGGRPAARRHLGRHPPPRPLAGTAVRAARRRARTVRRPRLRPVPLPGARSHRPRRARAGRPLRLGPGPPRGQSLGGAARRVRRPRLTPPPRPAAPLGRRRPRPGRHRLGPDAQGDRCLTRTPPARPSTSRSSRASARSGSCRWTRPPTRRCCTAG